MTAPTPAADWRATLAEIAKETERHLLWRWHRDKCGCRYWPATCRHYAEGTVPGTWDVLAVLTVAGPVLRAHGYTDAIDAFTDAMRTTRVPVPSAVLPQAGAPGTNLGAGEPACCSPMPDGYHLVALGLDGDHTPAYLRFEHAEDSARFTSWDMVADLPAHAFSLNPSPAAVTITFPDGTAYEADALGTSILSPRPGRWHVHFAGHGALRPASPVQEEEGAS